MIVYSKASGTSNSAIGKIETPIKMIIEHESDNIRKKGGVAEWLFNIEKSNRFGESIITQSEFDLFQAAAEGAGAELDTVRDAKTKFIEHVQFMKEFVITAEMMEDAQNGIAAEAKRRAENFTRAYYKTMNKLCVAALTSATNASATFAKATLDLTTSDGYPLFSNAHKYGKNDITQSNYYYGDIFTKTVDGARVLDPTLFAETLYRLAFYIRDMKDENGEALGYTADTIILPANRPRLELMVKQVCGTMYAPGTPNNDINVHYGNWNVIVLPGWNATNDSIMVMSSEANKHLSGNMLFNRVPLTVSNWIDYHTGNYIWNGRCRFGVGFGSYKHILLATDTEQTLQNGSKM